MATWYRPPNSPAIAFTAFHDIIDKIDAENGELYLLRDINCDVSSESPNCNTTNLLNICNIFNLSQVISEPTRITNTSKSLIDLCFTNFPDKFRASGVHSLGISDHSLIYMIRKSNWRVIDANNSVTKRQFKNFNDDEFLNDLREINWSDIHFWSIRMICDRCGLLNFRLCWIFMLRLRKRGLDITNCPGSTHH